MKMRSGEKIRLTSVEQLLGVPDEQNATEVEIVRIRPFPDHPFQVRDDEQMDDLVESIKVNGVITPVLLRDRGDGYEMISGHRRMHAAVRAGLLTIPAVIREMTDDEAIVYMVDANIQREELLPSEKAFAIKMKLDAMKRQAGRPSLEKNRQKVCLVSCPERIYLARNFFQLTIYGRLRNRFLTSPRTIQNSFRSA